MPRMSLPRNVVRLLSKLYRALYFADPIESDLLEYLTDDSSLLDDVTCYRIELERGRIRPEDLLDEADFAAVPTLLSIRAHLDGAASPETRTREPEFI